MSHESFVEVQLDRATSNALAAELADQGVRVVESVQQFMARAEEVAAIRASHRPPRRLSRRLLDDLDLIGDLLAEADAATRQIVDEARQQRGDKNT